GCIIGAAGRRKWNSSLEAKLPMKSDMQLQKDVLDELKWDPAVNAEQIRVEVKDGLVTLAGRVECFAEKWAAEWAAKRVAGVKALAVEIRVEPTRFRELTDADLARAAENALKWHAHVPQNRIKVRVEKGRITLEGEVEKQFEREIALQPTVEPTEVKEKIEAAFRRSAMVDAKRITVKAEGGKVILTGTVSTWEEYQDAERAAWAAPGVREMDNRLKID